ncbi:hypothetical protein ACJRO7_028835 [Eucalyptus globulus]|uniref:Fatty acyl-CoA reductase n=1 Tax=Eucalyptus globulus TaxID=34317 RepID=A0ABD3K2U7_EUCGL
MAIKDKDKGNCHDACVAATASPRTIMDMAWESRDDIGIFDFLERRNFLVTSAIGFLPKGNENKSLIYKILHITPTMRKIFLLIKAKDEQVAMDRVKDKSFECLKQKYEEEYTNFMLSKLVPVQGDTWEWNMGIGDDSFLQIMYDASLVMNIHSSLFLHMSIFVESKQKSDVHHEINLASDLIVVLPPNEVLFVVIIRPSVIEATFREPFSRRDSRLQVLLYLPFINNNNCHRELPGFLVNPNTVMYVVSTDLVANVIIMAMAKHGIAATSALMDNKEDKIQTTDMEYFSSIDKSGLSKEIDPNSNPKQRSRLEARCNRTAQILIHLAKLYEPTCSTVQEGNKFPLDLRSINWEDYFANAHIPGLMRQVIKKASSS